MSSNKHKQKVSHNRSILIAIVLLLMLLGGGLYLFHRVSKHTPPNSASAGKSTINFGPPSPADKQAAEQQKITQTSQPPATTPTPKSVTITSLTKDKSSDVVVQTRLTGTGWQTCVLTLTTTGANSVVMTAGVLYQPSYSTCEGFTVKASQLTVHGTWTATVSVTNSSGSNSSSEPATINAGP